MALALKKKVVWTTDMETTPELRDSGYVFVASPDAEPFARALERALSAEVTGAIDLSDYTWRKSNEVLVRELMLLLK